MASVVTNVDTTNVDTTNVDTNVDTHSKHHEESFYAKFVVIPGQYPTFNAIYEKAVSGFWTDKEVDVSRDYDDFNKHLKPEERHFIMHTLAYFAGSDGIVNENLAQNFYGEFLIPQARLFLGFQIAMENIHALTYSKLIESLSSNVTEKNELFKAIFNFPSVRKKADWALMFMDKRLHILKRLIAFMAVEGIFFSGSFCSIYWIKTKGIMSGLTFSNEQISKDEALHCDFSVLSIKFIIDLIYDGGRPRANHFEILSKYFDESALQDDQIPETLEAFYDMAYEIVNRAVLIEHEFTSESLPVKMIGMNAELMKEYIQYVAKFWLKELNDSSIDKRYPGVTNPFPFMELISMRGKSNFFEKRVAEYNKGGTSVAIAASEKKKANTVAAAEELDL